MLCRLKYWHKAADVTGMNTASIQLGFLPLVSPVLPAALYFSDTIFCGEALQSEQDLCLEGSYRTTRSHLRESNGIMP